MLELQGRSSALHDFALGNGARLGPYRLGPEIATGGMAAVHLGCLDGAHGFGRLVAIKRIHPHLAREREFVEMFLDEARIAARVSHPFVASVTDFGEWQGQPYITMELLFGEPISRVLSAVSKQPKEVGAPHYRLMVTRLIADLCEGLHAAHEVKDDTGALLGVIHRDISPTNLLVLYSGTPKILDFGIARAQNRLHQTLPGSFKGKLAYAAPEVLLGEAYDRRSDIWSMGVVLWEMLTNGRLFWGETDLERIVAVTKGRIPPPTERQPTIPPELEEVTMMALQRDPQRRYQTARAMSRDLERFLGHWGDSVPHADVADWVGALFPGAADRKQQLLRKAFSLGQDGPFGGQRTPPMPVAVPPPAHTLPKDHPGLALDSVKTELQQVPPGGEMRADTLPSGAPVVMMDGHTIVSSPASPARGVVGTTIGTGALLRARAASMVRGLRTLMTGRPPENVAAPVAGIPTPVTTFATEVSTSRRAGRPTRPMVLGAIGVAGLAALVIAVRFGPTPQAGWPAVAETPRVVPPSPPARASMPAAAADSPATTTAPAPQPAVAAPRSGAVHPAAGPGAGPRAPAPVDNAPPPRAAQVAPAPGEGGAAVAVPTGDNVPADPAESAAQRRRQRRALPFGRPADRGNPNEEPVAAVDLPAKGQLLVRTPDGPAEVFYKGRSLTQTPALLTFPPGEHELQIKREGSDEFYSLNVTVKAGETVVYDVREHGGGR